MKIQKTYPKLKKNNTKIRCKKIKGNFTTIQNNILFNKNLGPISKLVLMTILSDSDEFQISPTLIAKRLNVSVKSIYRAFDNLEDKGFLKRKEINLSSTKKLNYYTFSEVGNLKVETISNQIETSKKETIQVEVVTPKVEEEVLETPTLEQLQKLFNWERTATELEKHYFAAVEKEISLVDISLLDFKRFRLNLKNKLVNHSIEQKQILNETLDIITVDGTNKDRELFKNKMKSEITKQIDANEYIDIKAVIKKKKLYQNNTKLAKKTANQDQSYLN